MNWYPWGEEALARAKELDQPIFLSIGYAACHWCHVMERESFEDEDTAAELNARFVSVKVDREERPDLDSIYMGALQAMTGQGGWPMSMFLTPEGQPFYGGTYFPRQASARHPRLPGAALYASPRSGTTAASGSSRRPPSWSSAVRDEQDTPSRLMAALSELPEVDPADRLDDATKAMLKSFDPVNGGWGEAPKFPQAMSIELLLREHLRTGAKEPRLVAERTLDAMAAGGIYDHLGGWIRALLHRCALAGAALREDALRQRTAGPRLCPRRGAHRRPALRLCRPRDARLRGPRDAQPTRWRLRCLSLDADTEGVEGATYTWDAAEVREILGDDAPLFETAYDVSDEGNWEGRTILNRVRSDTDLAVEHERPRDEVAESLAQARTRAAAQCP